MNSMGNFFTSYSLIIGILAIVMIVSLRRIFSKSGKKWWKSLIPVYNLLKMIDIAKKPDTYFIFLFVLPSFILPLLGFIGSISTMLMFAGYGTLAGILTTLIPILSIVISIVFIVFWIKLNIAISRNFGRGVWFALWLVFLPFIFYIILAFGKDKYLMNDWVNYEEANTED